MIPPKQRAEWKALFESPDLSTAPWLWTPEYPGPAANEVEERGRIRYGTLTTGEFKSEMLDGYEIARYRETLISNDAGNEFTEADLLFIAAAREGWPATMKALEAAEQALATQVEEFCQMVCPYCHVAADAGIYSPAMLEIGGDPKFPSWFHPKNAVMNVSFQCEATPLRRKAYLRRY